MSSVSFENDEHEKAWYIRVTINACKDLLAELMADGEVMTITVIGSDERRCAKLLSGVEACTAGQRNTYCYSARAEEAAAAHDIGLSCGKYKAFLELQILDPSITPEAVREMTMREIRNLIGSLSASGADGTPSYDTSGNGHHGHGGGRGEGRGRGRH